jgi:UDP-N-acetylmuramoyl-L-alanyl-D-glutamate--2,6-diaminopimelate ligase
VVYSGDFQVLIDFAHTDMAMESLLSSLKEIAQGRILLVFGAGGSRDRTKRPRMGAAAARWADEIWITSDNPRQEEPTTIVAEIIAGIPAAFSAYHVEIDRRLAIEQAIGQAQRGDLLVIAGKGHEDYQIFRDRTVHFDDAEVVAEIMEKLACRK